MAWDPELAYVHLAADGQGVVTPGGAAFWQLPPAEMARFEHGWLVSEFVCSEDWGTWEMHPCGDEFVYLLSGDVELRWETAEGLHCERLTGRGATLIPRGLWHTARVYVPSRLLFITRGEGTRHRAAGES